MYPYFDLIMSTEFPNKILGGGGCNPKKTIPTLKKVRLDRVSLGFLNIDILAERYAYFYFPFKSFEQPQYIFL